MWDKKQTPKCWIHVTGQADSARGKNESNTTKTDKKRWVGSEWPVVCCAGLECERDRDREEERKCTRKGLNQ